MSRITVVSAAARVITSRPDIDADVDAEMVVDGAVDLSATLVEVVDGGFRSHQLHR